MALAAWLSSGSSAAGDLAGGSPPAEGSIPVAAAAVAGGSRPAEAPGGSPVGSPAEAGSPARTQSPE